MFDLFSDSAKVAAQLEIIRSQYGFAIWETLYSLVLEVVFAYVIGLPLGVLLVTGEKGGVKPLPKPVMRVLNAVINLLRSVPFLILMIICLPLSKFLVGTKVGTLATIPPMVIAAFPLVARMVESSLREVDQGVVEASQSMGATPWQIGHQGDAPRSTAQPDFRLYHYGGDHPGLWRDGRYHRRRRFGSDCHQLWLL